MKKSISNKLIAVLALGILMLTNIAVAVAEEPMFGPNAKGLKGTVYFYAGGFTPTKPTPDVPNPPQYLNTLVQKYEKIHPEVNIKIIPDKGGEYHTWRVTQLQGGTAPEILDNNYIRVWQEVPKGWYVPLDKYLEMSNPYIPEDMPGHNKWKNSILDRVWEETVYADGNQYLITPMGTGTGLFFNKEIFEELGFPTTLKTQTSSWSNWEDFINSLKKIKGAGYEPIAAFMKLHGWGGTYNWIDGVVLTSVYYDKIPEFYLKKKQWHVLSQEEYVHTILTDIHSAYDPEFGDFLDIMKELQSYWITGYMGMMEEQPYRAFINERAPLHLNMTSWLKDIMRDADFDWGVTYWPKIDEKTSKFCKNVKTSFLVGGYTSGWAVTYVAKEKELVRESIDWLMYVCAQENFGNLVNDALMGVPTIKKCEVSEAFAPFTPILSLPMRAIKDPRPRLTKRYGEEHRGIMQMFFTGQLTKKETRDKLQKWLMSEAKKAKAEAGWEW